jgi:hypothetical protein
MSKAGVPTPNTQDPSLNRVLAALKQNVDELTGQSRNMPDLAPLPATATLADVIAAVNKIIARLD